MQNNTDHIRIIQTTEEDLDLVKRLFRQAMDLQGKNGYKVWQEIDPEALLKDIRSRSQFKILQGEEVLCIFSVQHNDPFIWGERDRNDAIYLHRIVVNPAFKGQKQFEKVLDWAKAYVRQHGLRYVRMDTWAENDRIIAYYMSFGFVFLGHYKTSDAPELPLQNRNLHVALLELEVK
ncbi:GNAT family N-acetyltransferase [Chitinophaga sp. XS-30]|uniref:GNAT family N-acetyltransferase n=1 Tax=Chitinophaga sp. XS-30 TaxID=2604421 RepID=UPI0011DCE8B3|nr:GNAT family N-acetyltransferase [Chitinophaga sp. XS-30]QEH43814.1 GNAT family N-acetyltransferase [Chitinophaga sp. XS-30]